MAHRIINTKKFIPSGWMTKKIKDITVINPPKIKRNKECFVSFIPMAAVSENAKLVNPSEKQYSEISNGFTSFKNGDIIVAKITPCFENGKGALLTGLKNGIGFGSTEFHVLRPTDEVYAPFLFYHCISYPFRKRGQSNMTGSAGQKRIPASFIKHYSIPLPPLPEQKKIAQILGKWDEAIEKTQRLIEAKEKLKKGLMQQLLTGKRRFKEFKGQKWNKKCFKNLGIFSKGKGVSKSELLDYGFPAIRYGELYTKHHIFIREIGSYIGEESKKRSKPIRYGDILFAGSGETIDEIGKSAVYLGESEAYAGGDIILFSPYEKEMAVFLTCLLNSNSLRKELQKYGQGQSVVHVYKKNLEQLIISLPNLAEQEKIVGVVNAADKEIELLRDKLEELKKQKKGLMQKLLMGEVRVFN